MIQWFKWRKKYSHGPSCWIYDQISSFDSSPLSHEYIDEYIREELADAWTESEHYRGFDVELIDLPPKEHIETQIQRYLRNIQYAEQQLTYLYSIRDEPNQKN